MLPLQCFVSKKCLGREVFPDKLDSLFLQFHASCYFFTPADIVYDRYSIFYCAFISFSFCSLISLRQSSKPMTHETKVSTSHLTYDLPVVVWPIQYQSLTKPSLGSHFAHLNNMHLSSLLAYFHLYFSVECNVFLSISSWILFSI